MSIRSGTGLCPSAELCEGKYEQVKMAVIEICLFSSMIAIDRASVRSPVAAVVRGPVQALGRSVPAAGAVVH